MGAGLSQKQIRGREYTSLKRIQRELLLSGIDTDYRDRTIWPKGEDGDNSKFAIRYAPAIRASNGEVFGNLRVRVKVDGNDEFYAVLDASRGLRRIHGIYGEFASPVVKRDGANAYLITRINRAVLDKKTSAWLYVHNEDGTRLHQLYAYNEMSDGKPLVRIGQGIGPDDYTEFRPGWTVRTDAGEVLVERPLES